MLERLRDFRRDEDGSLSISLLFVVPILVWILLSTFVFFDAYRAEAVSERAGLTLADMFSRETNPITPEYLDNAQNLLRAVTTFDADPDFRVTAYQYFETQDEFRVIWSEHRGNGIALDHTDATFANIRDRVPSLADGEISLLVETQSEYTAPLRQSILLFDIDELEQVAFQTFVFISPRPIQVCWQASSALPPDCNRYSG